MSSIRALGGNPGSLATFDPMRSEPFRQTVRDISDRFRSVNGLPPLPHVEDEAPLRTKLEDDCRKGFGRP